MVCRLSSSISIITRPPLLGTTVVEVLCLLSLLLQPLVNLQAAMIVVLLPYSWVDLYYLLYFFAL